MAGHGPVQPAPSEQAVRKGASRPPSHSSCTHVTRQREGAIEGGSGQQECRCDWMVSRRRTKGGSATRRQIRAFQGEHFKYSVECITPSAHSHSRITNWNHFNSSCVGLDPIGMTSSSNGWGAKLGPYKETQPEGKQEDFRNKSLLHRCVYWKLPCYVCLQT